MHAPNVTGGKEELKYRNVCEMKTFAASSTKARTLRWQMTYSSNRVSIIPATAIYPFIYAIIADLLQIHDVTRCAAEWNYQPLSDSARLFAVHRWVLARSNQDPHSIAITMNQTSPGVLPRALSFLCVYRLSCESSDVRAKSREIKFRAVARALFGIISKFSGGPEYDG
jgi:hypothetical protein